MTLPEFLRAQLDEDQQQAEKLMRRAQDTQLMLNDHPEWLGLPNPGWHDWPDVETLCSQALADIAAKRAVLDLHAQTECVNCEDAGRKPATSCNCCHHDGDTGGPTYHDGTCGTVRAMAQPFRDRPGWSPEWKVEA